MNLYMIISESKRDIESSCVKIPTPARIPCYALPPCAFMISTGYRAQVLMRFSVYLRFARHTATECQCGSQSTSDLRVTRQPNKLGVRASFRTMRSAGTERFANPNRTDVQTAPSITPLQNPKS